MPWSSPAETPRSRHHPPRYRVSAVLLLLLASLGCQALSRPSSGPSVSLAAAPTASAALEMPPLVSVTLPLPSDQDRVRGVRLERRLESAVSPTATGVSTSSSTPQSSPTPLPSPFDDAAPSLFEGSGSNGKCSNYIRTLLSDPNFRSCYPLSMLIQTSNGFFDAQRRVPSIVGILDTACKADVNSCAEFLDTAAVKLTEAENCKVEVEERQSRVLQAWRGLRAYRTIYTASCLQDPSSNMYCFANSFANLTNPSDSYIYFMPYALSLPTASTLSCNHCTSETMRVYQAASANRSDLVSDTYEPAARQINAVCGPNFVNSTRPRAEGAASFVPPPASLALATTVLAAVVAFSLS